MPTIELANNPDTAEPCTDVTDIIMEVISPNGGLIGVVADTPTNDPDPIVVSAIPFSPEGVVDKSPEKWGWFASIGYAFWHLMETLESIKEKILRKQAPENLSNDEKETSSDGDEVHNHSKSYFESMNIFAWIPYFGSFFSTRNETKVNYPPNKQNNDTFTLKANITEPEVDNLRLSNDSEGGQTLGCTPNKVPTQEEIIKQTQEIIGTLKNQNIPCIPEDILPYLSDRDLEEIRSRLLMQCMRWNENRWCTKKAEEELAKCYQEIANRDRDSGVHELKILDAIQAVKEDEWSDESSD